MSRCKACDRKMTELEMCRKAFSLATGKVEYVELCTHCTQDDDEAVEFCQRKAKQNHREEYDE